MIYNNNKSEIAHCVEPISFSLAVTYIIHQLKEKLEKELEKTKTKIEQRRQLEYLLYKLDKLHHEYQVEFRKNGYSDHSTHSQNLIDHIKATQEVYNVLSIKYDIYDAKLNEDKSIYDKYEESHVNENNLLCNEFIKIITCSLCKLF
jgi:hypothetical protein